MQLVSGWIWGWLLTDCSVSTVLASCPSDVRDIGNFAMRGTLNRARDLVGEVAEGVAKSLAQDPKLTILDAPTRGIDMGSVETIRGIIRCLAREVEAVAVISCYQGDPKDLGAHPGCVQCADRCRIRPP